MPEMTDATARNLLILLCEYFEAYPNEDPNSMTCADLAGDLIESLPSEVLTASTPDLSLRFTLLAMKGSNA